MTQKSTLSHSTGCAEDGQGPNPNLFNHNKHLHPFSRNRFQIKLWKIKGLQNVVKVLCQQMGPVRPQWPGARRPVLIWFRAEAAQITH
jgi:hypothetical protein